VNTMPEATIQGTPGYTASSGATGTAPTTGPEPLADLDKLGIAYDGGAGAGGRGVAKFEAS